MTNSCGDLQSLADRAVALGPEHGRTKELMGWAVCEIERLRAELAHKEAYYAQFHLEPKGAAHEPTGGLQATAVADAMTPMCFKCGGIFHTDAECKAVESPASRSLIVSAEEAKAPLAFRHWSKDFLVPYTDCYCDTCVAARAEKRTTGEHR